LALLNAWRYTKALRRQVFLEGGAHAQRS